MAETAHLHHAEAEDPSNVTNPEHGSHHIVTPKQYTLVFITLIVGTIITVLAAYKDMGVLNPVIALAIACFKACVVILFFMHAKYQSRLIKLTIASGFFLFISLIVMTLSDYISRAWGRW